MKLICLKCEKVGKGTRMALIDLKWNWAEHKMACGSLVKMAMCLKCKDMKYLSKVTINVSKKGLPLIFRESIIKREELEMKNNELSIEELKEILDETLLNEVMVENKGKDMLSDG